MKPLPCSGVHDGCRIFYELGRTGAWKPVETRQIYADLCRSMQISQQNMENNCFFEKTMENMESGGLSEGNLNFLGHCILELTGGCDQVETFTAQHLGCIDMH